MVSPATSERGVIVANIELQTENDTAAAAIIRKSDFII